MSNDATKRKEGEERTGNDREKLAVFLPTQEGGGCQELLEKRILKKKTKKRSPI